MFRFFKKNSLKFLILPLIFFIGFKVNAKGIMIIRNGTPVEQCTNCWEMTPTTEAFITNYRVIEDPRSFSQNDTYYFTALIETQTLSTSIDVTDCGLNINGSYVTPNTRNSYRITNAQHGNIFTIRFQTEMTWQSPSTLTNVPVFIQCDTSPQAQTKYVAFSSTISEDDTSTGQSIANQTRDLIDNNNQNSNMIGGKIDNNTNVIGGKLDSHANTITGKLQQIIDNLSNLGSNIISGISSTIQSVGNGIKEKVEDLIGLNEVCTIFANFNGSKVITSNSHLDNSTLNYYLDSTGDLVRNSSYAVSDFIYIPGNSGDITITSNSNSESYYYCAYNYKKELTTCYNNVTYDSPITRNFGPNNRYIRITLYKNENLNIKVVGNCHKSGILGLFEGFTDFVTNFFNINTDGANTGFQGFIDKVADNDSYGGLQNIISSPLSMVNRMNSTCSSITIDIPYMQNNVQIPCMQSYLSQHLPSDFLNLVKLIVNGFVVYYGISSLLLFFHDLKDPHKDDLEVLEL